MEEARRQCELKKHGHTHHAQQLRRAPLLPFHHVVFDPMHGVHNEANVLLDEAVHQHLMVEPPDDECKKVISETQAKVNSLWKVDWMYGEAVCLRTAGTTEHLSETTPRRSGYRCQMVTMA